MTDKITNIAIPEEVILNKIYLIRGQKVMIDRDLAELYGVKPIRLREQVKRNIKRFPEKFMVHLTEKEVELMLSQNAIPSKKQLGGFLPYAFTEYGVLMLANILKSERAINASIYIIEVFVKLREMVLTHKDILLKLEQIEKKLTNHDEEIELIFNALKELIKPQTKERNKIGYKLVEKK
ncbi:MAG: ORF6N domain-containing protein [Bacteroidetes bacterium]|nr:ORF6N domain-containing protein [Bacteroidota bacterium]